MNVYPSNMAAKDGIRKGFAASEQNAWSIAFLQLFKFMSFFCCFSLSVYNLYMCILVVYFAGFRRQ